MNIASDDWLAEIIGGNVYRLDLDNQELITVTQIVDHMCLSSPAMYFTKIPTYQVETTRKLNALGFEVVDVNVTFKRKPTPTENLVSDSIQLIVDGSSDHRGSILEIAETAFVYSRFHLDPNISNKIANTIKRRWIESYIDGVRGERLMLAMVDEKPAGFLAVLAVDQDGGSNRVIDLIAVDNNYRGLGIGKALVTAFTNMYVGVCDFLTVGTQIANIPSIRLYESSGFLLDKTSYVMHAHKKILEVRN